MHLTSQSIQCVSATLPPCSDHEAEWAALEELEAADREQQRQQAAEKEWRELAVLQAHAAPREPTPEWAFPREQMQEWLEAQQAAVAASRDQQQLRNSAGEAEEEQLLPEAAPSLLVQVPEAELAGAAAVGGLTFQQLPPLPSPITSATVNLDATLARLLASSGNTPSGPLAKAAGRWESAGQEQPEQAGPQLYQEGEALFLLEPVLPAPLGEGIRCAAGAQAVGAVQGRWVHLHRLPNAAQLLGAAGGLFLGPIRAVGCTCIACPMLRSFCVPPPAASSCSATQQTCPPRHPAPSLTPGPRSAWQKASRLPPCAPALST